MGSANRSNFGWAHLGLDLALIVAAVLPFAAAAQAADPKPAPPASVGEVIVNGKRQPACSSTEPGGHGLNLACLNGQVKAAAEAGNPAPPAIDAAAAEANTPSKVGTFSQSATSERLGKNFGTSVTPYRPPPPVYANPITAGKPR